MYDEDEFLPLSGLQHILFCERQCALIHVEQSWAENMLTQEGRILHERVHEGKNESRKSKRSEFGIDIRSERLGVIGKTDAVDFFANGNVNIVEYKRGKPKEHKADEVQLCAQAMCIEEMMGTTIDSAQLYYGRTKHRVVVPLDDSIRLLTVQMSIKFHDLVASGTIPKARRTKNCATCSMVNLCMPEKRKGYSNVQDYIQHMILEDE